VGFCPLNGAQLCELASDTEFAVITEQSKFFTGSFTCIVGLAYPSIARGGITPYFTQLVDNGKVQDLFALQFCFTPTALTWTWASDGYIQGTDGNRIAVDTSGDGCVVARPTSLFVRVVISLKAFRVWQNVPVFVGTASV
jgi:hypothetical protein